MPCHCVADLSASLSPSQCVDPYTPEPGGTCALDTDGDGMADYQDKCPYQFGEDCTTPTPPPPSLPRCTRVTDTTWGLSWSDAAHGVTLYTRCPGGVDVSAGIVQTYVHSYCIWLFYILYSLHALCTPHTQHSRIRTYVH